MGNIRLVGSKRRKPAKEPRTQAAQNSKKVSKAPKEKGGRRSVAKTILIIALVVAFSGTIAAVAISSHIRGLDTIVPNVWAGGVELSGLTLEEAVEQLIAAGYESNADNVAVTVKFPNGSNFVLTGYEVGFALSAQEAAEAAFGVGRDGGMLENELNFIRTNFSRTELNDLSKANLNEDFVREVVAENTRLFNLELIDTAYHRDETSITIEVGTGVMPANEENVLSMTIDALFRALEEQTHLTVEYVPEETATADVDIQLLFDSINVDPISAEYDPETFSATQSYPGITFDKDAAISMLSAAQRGDIIVIPLIVTEPEVTTEEIDSVLFRDVLSERTTNIAGPPGRLRNIELTAEYINGTKLNPGDVFCFNGVVGRRTAVRGFQPAGGFAGGRLVDMVGGGICQTSSTIYYAVLRANLQVVERRNHGLTVGYLPLGHDATVYWGQIDFRFANDRDYPIMLETVVQGRELTVRIIGTTVDEYTFTTDFVVLSSTPFQVIRRPDPTLNPGQTRVDLPGSNGVSVEVFINRIDGEGNRVDRWSVGVSRYNVQNRVIYYGPEPEPTEPPPEEQPPEEQPPLEQPPTEQPPIEQPPAELPPVEQPPAELPPVEQPPVEQPPVEQPPVEQPPVEQPPVEQPPTEQPPEPPPTQGNEEEAPLF